MHDEKKFLTKYFSNKNILKNKNNKISKNSTNFENYFSLSHNKNKFNSIDYKVIDGKEEFFKDKDEVKYCDYLRKQYKFFDDIFERNQLNFKLKTKRRKNMFNSKPENYSDKTLVEASKSDFLKNIKRKIKYENSPIFNSNKSLFKKKIGEFPSLSARIIKTVKFNNDCNRIYEKFKKKLILH